MTWLLVGLLAFDLAAVRSEPNLERRSEMALDVAAQSLKSAREAYRDGKSDAVKSLLEEVRGGVDVAYESLVATGKDPRKSPKYFKRAEMSTRQLLRRLEAFKGDMSVEDRELIEPVIERTAEVHDALIRDIMGKKR